MSYEVNFYHCVSKPTVIKTIPVYEWFDQIQNPPKDLQELIIKAREIGKYNNGYDTIKESLPVVTYNFLFNKYKKDDNIISSTGLLFIEIDEKGFDISSLDSSKLFAYYKSLS